MANVFIYIPTAWTFSTVKDGADITALNTYFASVGMPAVEVGGANPFWVYVEELGVTGDIQRASDASGMASFGPLERTEFLEFGPIGLTLLVGGEVTGLPIWFEVAAANYGDAVPASLSDSGTLWSDWTDGVHNHFGPWDGKYYIAGNSLGYELDASVWHPIHASPPVGVRVLTESEFVEIASAN